MAGISFPLDENHNFSKAFKPLPQAVRKVPLGSR